MSEREILDGTMRLLLPSFVFALAVGLAQQEVDLRYRFAIGDESKAALSGKVWLYHYIWGGLGSLELARIEDGRAHIRLSRERLASEIRRNLHPGAYLVVLEFPGGQWYRTADLDHLSLFSRLDASLHALGKSRREPSGETLLVVPPASKRRITLRFEDGRPAPGREVHVSIFISRENHCGAHEGPDLGAFRTDPRGAIEFLAPLVKLYLDAPHYEREKEYWAVNGLTVGPEPDVVVQKAWDLPKRHYELRVRAADGSPAAGVVISQTLRTRECGVSTGAVGQTDAAGVARIEIAAAATERLELAAANRPPRPLSGAELHALFSQGRITLPAEAETWPIRHNHDHVQGLDVSDRWFWISAVDRRTKTGWVWRVDRQTLRTVAERNITQGALYHPGGLQVSGSSLWIPIAEYRPNSSSRILELDAMTLAERRSFVVPDHIGAVATDGKTFVLGANWDARKLYRWNLDGKLLESRDNPTSLAIQDMKWASEVIYTGGLDQKTCRVDQLDSLSLTLLRSSIPGTDRCYTEEGMAIFGGRFFFLPEDQPNSRVYAFSLP